MSWERDNNRNAANSTSDPQQRQGTRNQDQPIIDADGHEWIKREQAAGRIHAQSLACPECEGEMIWASFSGYTFPYYHAGTASNMRPVISLVCTNCGFTKLFTAQPRKLLE